MLRRSRQKGLLHCASPELTYCPMPGVIFNAIALAAYNNLPDPGMEAATPGFPAEPYYP